MAITTTSDVKTYLGISTTDYDNKIASLIPFVEQVYLRLRNAPFDEDEAGDTVYPTGSDITAAEMIGYKLSQDTSFRFEKSTRLGNYSVSYGDKSIYGYPAEIIGAIKRYMRML